MAEIQLTRIKSLYGEAKGYLDSIKDGGASGPYTVPRSIVDNFNIIVDELSNISGTDYSRSKIPESELREIMSLRLVMPLVAAFVGRLDQEYGFSNQASDQAPAIVIFNKNENDISLKINYTINELVEKYPDEESKKQLMQLESELGKKDKNWEKIKGILIWILNFSKELFLEVIPIILQKRI